jgi:hypothetical protein
MFAVQVKSSFHQVKKTESSWCGKWLLLVDFASSTFEAHVDSSRVTESWPLRLFDSTCSLQSCRHRKSSGSN